MSDHLGGSEGASGNADTSLADSALSEKEANNFPNELPASSALAASPAQRQSGSPRPTLRPATPEVLLSGSGADTDAAPRPVIRQVRHRDSVHLRLRRPFTNLNPFVCADRSMQALRQPQPAHSPPSPLVGPSSLPRRRKSKRSSLAATGVSF